jgi:hypothetical protein
MSIVSSVSIPIQFRGNVNTVCNRVNSTVNSSLTYTFYEKLRPTNATYLAKNDINDQIKILTNSIIGKDYITCELSSNPILPYVSSYIIENMNTALQYCTLFKNKCIGITSVDKNNIYWKLISTIGVDNNNYNLIKDDTNTYVTDTLNLQTEYFNPLNNLVIVRDPTFFVWTDELAIIVTLASIGISVIIYCYYRHINKLGEFSLF